VTAIRSYRDLVVWQRAMALAALCDAKTRSFPRTEAFGMTAQIRRAAASIPANIAEGNGRERTGSYIHFLRISQGSLKELETHVLLAQTVELMNKADAEQILEMSEQVGKMLRALIRRCRTRKQFDAFPTRYSLLPVSAGPYTTAGIR
jgi:four helix bundle protein